MRNKIVLFMIGMGLFVSSIGDCLPPEKPIPKGPEIEIQDDRLDLEDETDFEEEDFQDFDAF